MSATAIATIIGASAAVAAVAISVAEKMRRTARAPDPAAVQRLVSAAREWGHLMSDLYARGDGVDPAYPDHVLRAAFRLLELASSARHLAAQGRSAVAEGYWRWIRNTLTGFGPVEGLRIPASGEPFDHLISDELDAHIAAAASDIGRFEELARARQLDDLVAFVDGAAPTESRHRWDRLVSLHLAAVAVLGTFGTARERATDDELVDIVRQIRHREVLRKLPQVIEEAGLAHEREPKRICRVVARGL